MNTIFKYISILILILLGTFLFYTKVYIPKTTYSKIKAIKGDISIKRFGIGELGAKEIYSINSLTSSKIKALYTDVGQWVKKGDLLVELDSVDLPQLLKEAKIAVKKAQFELLATQKELESLKAQRALALQNYKRYKRLWEKLATSKLQYDKAKSDYDSIEAQISATKAKIDSAKEEIKRSQANVKALQIKLSRYKIYAPISGYVISKEAEITQSVVPTQAIFKIVNPKDVWVKAYIDERISGDIKVGQRATVTLRSKPKEKFEGIVKRIVPQSDAITQEREVDISFKKLPIPFYINEQSEVLITTKILKDIIKIPSKALVKYRGKRGVWILKSNKAHFRAIKVIGISDNIVAVDNLNSGEVILIPSKDKKPLFDGARVR